MTLTGENGMSTERPVAVGHYQNRVPLQSSLLCDPGRESSGCLMGRCIACDDAHSFFEFVEEKKQR